MKLLGSKLALWILSAALIWNPPSALVGAAETAGSVPMPSEQDDRGGSQNGASAMAMAAAAMQQVMCLKMMADAQAEGNSEKMAMAMMMCAQAAATAANAAQNKEGAKKVTLNNQNPSAPSFEKSNLDTQPKADNFNFDLASSKEKTSQNSNDKKDTSEVKIPNAEESKAGNVFQEDKQFASSGSPINADDLKPSPSSTINLKESPPQSMGASLMGGLGNLNNGGNSQSILGSSNLQLGTADTKTGKKSGAKGPETGSAEGGTQEDLMARYMNGAAGFGMMNAGGFGGGVIDLAFGLQTPGQRPKTIFEFASEQYHQVKSNGKSLSKPASKRPLTLRQLASE